MRAIVHKALAASINTVSSLWCARSALSPVQRFHGAQDFRQKFTEIAVCLLIERGEHKAKKTIGYGFVTSN